MRGNFKIEKFPELNIEGRRLIWDSRQTVVPGAKELVFVLPETEEAAMKALLSRKNARFVGARASGLSQEIDNPRLYLAQLSAEALGYPSRKIRVFAVTGTNGKTTCASLMRHLFCSGGAQVCEIGTLGVRLYFHDGENKERVESFDTGFTTPEAPTLQHIFSQLPALGIDTVVMEASSHAVALSRCAAVDFNGVLFTNLTQDHLDFHKTMEDYELAKTRLFTELLPDEHSKKKKFAVVNTAEAPGRRVFAAIPASLRKRAYALGEGIEIKRLDLEGLSLKTSDGLSFESSLVGRFNAENIMGCSYMALEAGLDRKLLQNAISTFRAAPGRLERVSDANRFVFVDYAHSPDALDKVLQTLRACKNDSAKLSVVFGCGGDRDRSKRPLMGGIAARLADQIILCSDNPRTENPQAIIEEIFAGVPADRRDSVKKIEDRKAAIETALSRLQAGDVCVVAGKGHEDYQIIGRDKRPFSDVAICSEALRKHPL